MSQARKRGRRGGKRAQRGYAADREAARETAAITRYDRLAVEGHALYAAEFRTRTGLQPSDPAESDFHLWLPLNGGWMLEVTAGDDGPLYPVDEMETENFLFWLHAASGGYAEEESTWFPDAAPAELPAAVVEHGCAVLLPHLEEILGDPRATQFAAFQGAATAAVAHLVARRVINQENGWGDEDGRPSD